MALNGDSVVAEGERKVADVTHKMLHLLNEAMEKGAGTLVGKIQSAAAQKEKQKLMESFGVTKEFQQYMDSKEGKMQSFMVPKKDYIDFAREMKKRDIPFLTYDVLGDDCYSVLYRDIDKPKVELSIKAFKDSRNLETEMTADRFAEKYAGQCVQSINGIDPVELELIRHYAAKNNFQFAAQAIGDGSQCKILFSDQSKMDEVMKKAAWALTGEKGPLVKQQIEYRIAGRESGHRILSQEEAEKEFYIASKEQPSHYMHITANDIELYKDNKVVTTISHDDTAFYDKSVRALCGMDEPVALSEDEWMSSQRQAIIASRQEVIPTGSSAADKVVGEMDEKERPVWQVMEKEMNLADSYGLEKQVTEQSYADQFSAQCVGHDHDDAVVHAAAAAMYLHDKHLTVVDEYMEPVRSEEKKEEIELEVVPEQEQAHERDEYERADGLNRTRNRERER